MCSNGCVTPFAIVSFCLVTLSPAICLAEERARDLGIVIGRYDVGEFTAITDVDGVRVGHVTLISGEGELKPGEGPVRTGVTAIIPAEGDYWYENCRLGPSCSMETAKRQG